MQSLLKRAVAVSALASLLLWSVAGCAPAGEGAPGQPLRIAVAANFHDTLEALAADWHAQGGCRLELVRGATGSLVAQVRAGAPMDVLLAADRARPQSLAAEGFALSKDPVVYARGRLRLVGKALSSGESGDRTLARKEWAHLAIANPHLAPYGRAAVETLTSLGVYEGVRARLVYGENVAQVAAMVQSGAADLALVAAAQVREGHPGWLVPRTAHRPVEQAGVVLQRSGRAEDGQRFLDWLVSDAVQAQLAVRGYERVAP